MESVWKWFGGVLGTAVSVSMHVDHGLSTTHPFLSGLALRPLSWGNTFVVEVVLQVVLGPDCTRKLI